MPDRRIIYIMGTARAGTTLLAIMLGNAAGAFCCGEVRKFPILRGEPHGFGPQTENHRLWQRVASRFFGDRAHDYDDLWRQTTRLEKHAWFPWIYLDLLPARLAAGYARATSRLFASLFEETGASVLIDSSKYPARALALYSSMRPAVSVIYLRRHRKEVVQAFGKTDVEQPPKNRWMATVYYLIVRVMCALAYRRIDKTNRICIDYDTLVRDPEGTLRRIGAHFDVELDRAIDLVSRNAPLQVGCLFEGNRIRLQRQVVLTRAGK